MAAEEVEDNEGLLISILVWLPPLSVFRFRCVSKRWKSIIDDRFFLESYGAGTRNRQLFYGGGRILALIQEKKWSSLPCSNSHMNILPIPTKDNLDIMQIPRKFGYFVSTSNGLILCSDYNRTSFHLVNPMTRTWVKVPQLKNSETVSFGFVCEENTREMIPSFRIVGVDLNEYFEEDDVMRIETYSSNTGNWTTSTLIGTEKFDLDRFGETYVSNGAFHWPINIMRRSLAVYDPNEDENHVQLIKLPEDGVNDFTLTRSSNDDIIWIAMMDRNFLKFWKLPKDEHGGYKRATTIAAKEWVLMHIVDTQSLCKDATLFLGNKDKKKRDVICYFSLRHLSRGTQWPSF